MKEVDASLHQKASKENLNATEKKLLDILELSFAQLGDKFASKSQTSEAIFKLKSQLKSVFELLISTGVIRLDENEDQEDTAMLMKKPINGFSCASCETKLQNISTKAGLHTNWKKMPARDPLDRLPRAGQGFSKILQSIKTPRDLQWDDETSNIGIINPPLNSQLQALPMNMLQKGKLTRSHMLIPQTINETDSSQLPKLTTPRKNE